MKAFVRSRHSIQLLSLVIFLFVFAIPGISLAVDASSSAAASASADASIPKPPKKEPDSQTVDVSNSTTHAAMPTAAPLPKALTILIMIGMTITWVFGLLSCLKLLKKQGWSLATALSEEAKVQEGTPPVAAGAVPPMVPSSSRFSAMIGTILLGTFFVAIGYYVIWQLCNAQPIDLANGAWAYFAGGAALFFPYAVNKATSFFP
ncbi:MAG TPA: hypothetical protein VF472_03760 [Burkholderiaceae bacterium]